MKLLFKQRFFSWFDSYDIYNEQGETVFTVEGKLSWGHCLHILDASGKHIATLQQVVLTFLPRFEMFIGEELIGTVTKEFSFFSPRFTLDCRGWTVTGNFFEWDYSIVDRENHVAATISKELFQWTDTYRIDVSDPADALSALLVVFAIDAEKCSRN